MVVIVLICYIRKSCGLKIDVESTNIGKNQFQINIHRSITDKNKVQSIIKNTIKPHFGELTIGSTEPLILVKNDGNAVLFCYKTANGTNIIHIHEFNDKEKNWSETTKNIDGEVPLKDQRNI